MSLPLVAWNVFGGMATEVTWSTPVTPSTHWLPIVSCGVEETPKIEASPVLGHTNAQVIHQPRDLNVVARDAGGPIVTIPSYDLKAYAFFLLHCMGGSYTTAGAGPYTHEISLGRDVGGFTYQRVHGQHGSLDVAEIFPGAVVNDWELSCDAQGHARHKANIICQKASGMSATSGTPSIAVTEEMLGNHFSDFTWNSVAHRMSKFAVKVNRNLRRRPYLGSLYTDQPTVGGMADVRVSVELDWVSHALYAAMLASTRATGQIILTGTGNNRLTIDVDGPAVITKASKPLDAADGMRLRLEWWVPALSTATGLKLTLRNDNSNPLT